MASLPLAGEVSFEDGTKGLLNSETDTDSKLAVKHYSLLAKTLPFVDAIPYRGAYCAHIDLSGGTNDAYYQEDDFTDSAASATLAIRFYVWLSQLVMATSDRFTLCAVQSGAGTDEATVGVINNAGTIQFVFGETGATAIGAGTRVAEVVQNQWHCIEMVSVIDSGVGNDGTITAYVDGYQVGAAITALDQGAITQTRLGAIGIDAGTTRGHILLDMFAVDTARIGPLANRFGQTRVLTQSGHAVLGQASIIEADLVLSSANDETCQFFDTDSADTLDISKRVFIFGQQNPVHVTRGLYAVLAGTSPILGVKLCSAEDMSSAGIQNIGRARY